MYMDTPPINKEVKQITDNINKTVKNIKEMFNQVTQYFTYYK